MSLFARTETGKRVYAGEADHRNKYSCFECAGNVKRRKGHQGVPTHFLHLNKRTNCRQGKKCALHLQVVQRIVREVSEKKVEVEKEFPEVDQIVDVAWKEKRLLFCVQCAPISAKDVRKINRNHSEMGYQNIWILHDTHFNKRRLTAAEHALFLSPHYYTNIDPQGNGSIYDQLSQTTDGIRKKQSPPLPVSIDPIATKNPREERVTWKVHFQKDLTEVPRQRSNSFFPATKPQEGKFARISSQMRQAYRALICFALEKLCRR